MVAGRYELERPLGHGAMAVVDLARDVELDRPVALKRLAENLARDDELRARFLREARLAARLAHPNVVHVYDVGEDDGRPFIAMEYVDGETLAELVARGAGRCRPTRSPSSASRPAAALAAAHAAGLVHRDVKPQNLLLRRDGVLKLGDFGIAFGLEGTRLTHGRHRARHGGVPRARAGARRRGHRGGRRLRRRRGALRAADRAAAAHAASIAELAAATTIEPPAGAPPALAAVVMRCLAADPQRRPASAAELAQRARGHAPGRADAALPSIRRSAPRRSRRARGATPGAPGVALAAIAVGAIAGGVGAAIATSGGGSKPPPATRHARARPCRMRATRGAAGAEPRGLADAVLALDELLRRRPGPAPADSSP